MEQIAISTGEQPSVGEQQISTGWVGSWRGSLLGILARPNMCSPLISREGKRDTVVAVGRPANVNVTRAMYDWIAEQLDRWLMWLPWPLRPVDRDAGYRHRLSIWQLEMSLTQVFTTPVYGRHLFEAVIRDNLDLGRPDRVSPLFPIRFMRRTPPPDLGYKTGVITYGVAPSLHVEFKHSHVEQYFKEQRALRTETTINDPLDLQRTKGLDTLPHPAEHRTPHQYQTVGGRMRRGRSHPGTFIF